MTVLEWTILKSNSPDVLFRVSLQSMLKFSSLYNASLLLSKIPEESGLDLETAMLYGRVSLTKPQFRIEQSRHTHSSIYQNYKTKVFHLHFQLEHHEKALKIYAYQLADFDGAVAYCEFYSKVHDFFIFAKLTYHFYRYE
jgi:hypothetical protein